MECNLAPSRWTQCRWLLPLLIFAAGCGKTPATSSSSAGGGTAENALAEGERITAKMLAVYRQAKTYTDHASYVQHAVFRGEGVERELPFFHMSIALARPNRVRLNFQ